TRVPPHNAASGIDRPRTTQASSSSRDADRNSPSRRPAAEQRSAPARVRSCLRPCQHPDELCVASCLMPGDESKDSANAKHDSRDHGDAQRVGHEMFSYVDIRDRRQDWDSCELTQLSYAVK